MMNTHGIVGQPWQFVAAKDLKAIILPLTGGWVSGDPRGWPPIEALGSGYEVGDRIYLQEEWEKEYLVPGLTRTQPAHTMPPEAAQHWYTVAGVRVTQMNEISLKEMRDSFLFDPLADDLFDFLVTVKERWNAAHPEHLWYGDRWVVVLSVEAIDQ
jgi:hypothetical protein